MVISSDLPEVMNLAHRLVVFSARPDLGRARGRSQISEQTVLAHSSTSSKGNRHELQGGGRQPWHRASNLWSIGRLKAGLFLRVGVLPFFLVAALVVFTLASPQFLTAGNLTNVARQSVYLMLVSLGQMLALVTGGFDLSVGTSIALTSVVSAIVMVCAGDGRSRRGVAGHRARHPRRLRRRARRSAP